jgi:hypothetical protein
VVPTVMRHIFQCLEVRALRMPLPADLKDAGGAMR